MRLRQRVSVWGPDSGSWCGDKVQVPADKIQGSDVYTMFGLLVWGPGSGSLGPGGRYKFRVSVCGPSLGTW